MKIMIIVGQRGWSWVGRVESTALTVTVYEARVIRQWGTDKGLAQLANNGPTGRTVLDEACDIELHPLSIVAKYHCNQEAWEPALEKLNKVTDEVTE